MPNNKLNVLFFLLSSFFYVLLVAESTHEAAPASDFIRAECQTTRFRAVCVQSLSNYATSIGRSQRQLARAALSVSLTRAKSAVRFVSKQAKMRGMTPREHGAVRDCTETMVDSVDQLRRSMEELDGMGSAGQDFKWHMSNVQTWVSAALTDETTCLEGFGGAREQVDGKVKVAIKKRVIGCAQVTSNALALVNRFAARHGA